MLELLNAIPRELILPPTSLFLLIALGLLLWRRWPRLGRWVAGTGLALLTFLSTTGGAGIFVAPLERMTVPLRTPERMGAQAIVVLAAGRLRNAPEYGGRDIPDYVALARLRYGAHLQRRTGLPLLVSGGTGAKAGKPGFALADAMSTALREDFGVPVKWLERGSRDTAENASFSAAMLRASGVKRILLVTDAMHMARARIAFERAGLEVIDAPTVFFSRPPAAGEPDFAVSDWLPSAEGTRLSWYAVYELIGLAWYRVRLG